MSSSRPMAKRRKAADAQQQALFAVQHQQTLEKIRKHFDKHPEKVSEVHRMLVSVPYCITPGPDTCSLAAACGWLGFFLGPSSAGIAVHWAIPVSYTPLTLSPIRRV